MATRIEYSEKLNELQRILVEMGTKTIKAIEDSILGLVNQDVNSAQKIVDEDVQINKLESDINTFSTLLIAEEQPVATDLRIILNAIHASHILERVADSAVHVAKSTIILVNEGYFNPLVDIRKMARIALDMLKEAIDSYASYDTQAARKIAERDVQVDKIYADIFKELLAYMHEDPSKIDQCMTLLFVCRRLERIADQTTHICEGIIYVAEGKIVELNM